MKSFENMAPDGLFGLLMMIALVYEPTGSAISSTVGWKLPSSGVIDHRDAARELHHLRVAHPIGSRENNFVLGIEDGMQQDHNAPAWRRPRR